MTSKYQVLIKAPAARMIKGLDSSIKNRIKNALERLSNNPYIGKSLSGPLATYWSYRTGHFRIVYEIVESKLIIYVVGIGHRRDIYSSIKKILERIKK